MLNIWEMYQNRKAEDRKTAQAKIQAQEQAFAKAHAKAILGI